MIRYVKVAERHGEGCYRPLTRRQPVYRVGEIVRASCTLVDGHHPPERACQCGIYCATVHGLAWVPYYYDPYDPACALLLVQPVGRALGDGRVLRVEKVLVLGEVDVRTLVAPRLRKLDQLRLIDFLKAAAWLRVTPKASDRVLQLHYIWRALGRRVSRKRCEAFWRAYRAQPLDIGCPFCRRRGGKR